MTRALILLTLLGCGDAEVDCDVIEQPAICFETRAACQEAADALLERAMNEPYPVLVTQCGTLAETLKYLRTVAPPDQVAVAARRNCEHDSH